MFYKIVDTNLRSVTTGGKFEVKYKLGEFVSAPEYWGSKSKLFVFHGLKRLEEFTLCLGNPYRIFECDVKNPEPILKICKIQRKIKTFWKLRQNKHPKTDKFTTLSPLGSYICDAVKLDKELEL